MSMTRKRAIQILKMNEQEKWRSGITAEEEKEAVDMAIEALKKTEQTINTNQNPCIYCCVKYSCKGICEKRYLWNLKKEGEAE